MGTHGLALVKRQMGDPSPTSMVRTSSAAIAMMAAVLLVLGDPSWAGAGASTRDVGRRLDEALREASKLRDRKALHEARSVLESVLSVVTSHERRTSERIPGTEQAMDELGDLMIHLHTPEDAVQVHQRSLARRIAHNDSAGQLAAAWGALARDLNACGQYSAALRAAHRAEEELTSAVNAEQAVLRQSDPSRAAAARGRLRTLGAARASLGMLGSEIADCAGDPVSALLRFERSAPEVASAMPTAPLDRHLASLTLRHAALLLRAASDPTAPQHVRQAMRDRRDAQIARVLRLGPWSSPLQLPSYLRPGLAARAWHDVHDASLWGPQASAVLRSLETLLQSATDSLAAEADRLLAGGRMERETECLHYYSSSSSSLSSSSSGEAVVTARGEGRPGSAEQSRSTEDLLDPASAKLHSGEWRRFSLNGYWHSDLNPDTGCSAAAPVACSVVQRAQQLASESISSAPWRLRVVRAEYSVLEPRVSLSAHHGRTNSQLKMHLGLRIPRATTATSNDVDVMTPCAFLRVGNETRAWRVGHVFFFDDSFEHEVTNSCDEPRIVFQIVFAHPQLPLPDAGSRSDQLQRPAWLWAAEEIRQSLPQPQH